MPSPKMTVKDLSVEVEMLKQKNDEKDSLIKALDDKISSLQNWAQGLYTSFLNKSNESDQQHFNNVKILDKKISEVHEKFDKFAMEQTEARKEETAKKVKVVETKFKCRDCGEIFNKKETL